MFIFNLSTFSSFILFICKAFTTFEIISWTCGITVGAGGHQRSSPCLLSDGWDISCPGPYWSILRSSQARIQDHWTSWWPSHCFRRSSHSLSGSEETVTAELWSRLRIACHRTLTGTSCSSLSKFDFGLSHPTFYWWHQSAKWERNPIYFGKGNLEPKCSMWHYLVKHHP